MAGLPENAGAQSRAVSRSERWTGLLIVLAVAVLVGLLYLPLLRWLGWMTLQTEQLVNGGLLVLLAVAICARQAMRKLALAPAMNHAGLGLLLLAVAILWLAARAGAWLLPLVLISFCLSVAGIVSLLFGKAGIRCFLPALGAFFVFGVLVGLVPTLDWPLRALAARYAGGLLSALGLPVEISLARGQPAQLLLGVGERLFVVATECNGLGLLTSSLLVATILAFQYRLPWLNRLGLLALSIPVAIVCNFLRIVSICLVAPRTQLPYVLIHETIGVVFYLLGLGLIWYAARRAAVVTRQGD